MLQQLRADSFLFITTSPGSPGTQTETETFQEPLLKSFCYNKKERKNYSIEDINI